MKRNRIAQVLFFFLILLSPTQLTKHWWHAQSLVLGRRIDYLSIAVYLSDFIIIAFIGWSFLCFRKRFKKSHLVFFLGIIVLSTSSSILSPLSLVSGIATIKLIEYALLWEAIVLFRPQKQHVLTPLFIISFCALVLALLEYFTQRSVGGIWYFFGERSFSLVTPQIAHGILNGRLFLRPYSFFPHPNVLGGVSLLWLSIVVFVIPSSLSQKILSRVLLAILVVLIVISFSRVALIGLVIVLAVLMIKRIKKIQYPALLFFPFILMPIGFQISRFSSLLSTTDTSVSERVQLFSYAQKIFVQSPLFGLGFGQFIPLIPSVTTAPYLLQPAHSSLLVILLNCGIIGLCFFLFFLGYVVTEAIRVKNKSVFITIGLWIFLGLFDHYLFTLQQGQLMTVFVMTLPFWTD